MGEDYYALLSIEVNATAAQIKKAYRDKAKFWHPDKNTAPNAHQTFIKIKKAYDCLANEDERRKYNLTRPAPRQHYHQQQQAQPGSSHQHYTSFQHSPNGPFTWTFKRQEKTPPKMNKSEECRQREANGIFADFMSRMKRQREEEMRRRHEAFSQEAHEHQVQADLERSRRMARLKLFWPKNVLYSVSDLKTRLNAELIFSSTTATKNGATVAFRTAQEALTASQVLEAEFDNIELYWLTVKPSFDAKKTIHIDSDDDVELVVDDDDDDIEIVEPNLVQDEELFIITDSEDENFDVIVEPDEEEAAENEEEDDVQMISDLSDSEDEMVDEDEAMPFGHVHIEQQQQQQQQQREEHNEPIEISDTESEDEDAFIITNTLNDNGRTTPIVIL